MIAAIYRLRDADTPLGEQYSDYYVWEVAEHLIFYLWESPEQKIVDEILPLSSSWDALLGSAE
ncbi:MAG: hypothetical protein R2911_13120 [Caldilineaceae bacterium]